MLRSGKLLYKKHVKRSKREENARRRMKQAACRPRTRRPTRSRRSSRSWTTPSTPATSEAAKKSLGRGKKQRMEKFFSLARRLYAGMLWKKIETDVLKRRALNARKGAKLVDDSKLNYSAFTAMRKELGEHGTKEKRVTGQTVIPSAPQRANADLDAYVAQKGLMCAGEGEMWHANYGKIMPSTFEIYGYQGATTRRPTRRWATAWLRPDAPIPMMIGCAADELPCETGVGGTGLMAMAIHHCDPRLSKNVRESPQMDEHVQPVVLYPTKQRKRKLDEKARAATAYATARSEARRLPTVSRGGTEATCTHWDMATPATKQYFEDREKALAERVGTLPDEVLPFWRNKAEATEIARKLKIKLKSGAKLETIESAIRGKCDCLTVLKFWELLSPHDHVDSPRDGTSST
ncbi:hypothetical protein JL720_9894 [Aureococcus anophagefferens]|nr:hypothetical protein JL720_9894 [Aureococcus anophagefferens]